MITYEYNKDFKYNLTDEDIIDILQYLGAEPINKGTGTIISKTICHCGEHHKLYYWSNTHLFKCFSDCGETFDIFELVRKVKSQESNTEWPLPKAIEFVAEYFGVSGNEIVDEDTLEDWDLFNSLDKLKDAGAT